MLEFVLVFLLAAALMIVRLTSGKMLSSLLSAVLFLVAVPLAFGLEVWQLSWLCFGLGVTMIVVFIHDVFTSIIRGEET